MTQVNLSHLTILDFSHRLPGPLAGHILSQTGAKVIKVEDKKFKDPFIAGLFADNDKSFIEWYNELNQNKEILRLDFGSSEIKSKIRELLISADAVVLALPEKLKIKLGLDKDSLKSLESPLAVVELHASKEESHVMHDLNALALSGLLDLYVADKSDKRVAPPFLPFAGIIFGSRVATDILATYIQTQKNCKTIINNTYLLESTEDTLSPFWPKAMRKEGRSKFLHNGIYPCYNLYKTEDSHYLALACVEDKFWMSLVKLLDLDLSSEDKFEHNTSRVFEVLERRISSMPLSYWKELLEKEHICVSFLEK